MNYALFRLMNTLILSSLYVVIAAQHDLQGLQHVIDQGSDTSQVMAYCEMAKKHQSDSSEYALELLQQAMDLAKTINFERGIGKINERTGVVYDIMGNLTKAHALFDNAEKNYENAESPQIDFMGLAINRGVSYYYAGNFGKALEQYLLAEQIGERIGEGSLRSLALNNIGVVYRHRNEHEKAIEIYEKSIGLKRELGDREGVANSLRNIGLAQSSLHNYKLSLPRFQQARDIYEELGLKQEVTSLDIDRGVAYYQLNIRDSAIQVLERALNNTQLKAPAHDICQSKYALGKSYQELGQLPKAKYWLDQAAQDAESTDFIKLQAEIFEALAMVNKNLGNVAEAFSALKNYTNLQDSISTNERIKLQEELAAKFQSDLQEEKIVTQQLQLERAERSRITLIAGIVFVALVFLLTYRLYRLRQIANKELQAKNEVVNRSLVEKENLLKEIHHRVKNNLQIISSILSLQSRQLNHPGAINAIREGQHRIRSMAMIHQQLYQDENLDGVDAATYIKQLTETLIKNFKDKIQNIDLELDLAELKLDPDALIPIGLILNELVSNILKYAFTGRNEGKIHISFKPEETYHVLSVSDNGVGLPMDKHHIENADTLGFKLVRAFVDKLNATLSIDNEIGTSIRIEIPNLKEKSISNTEYHPYG